MKGSKRYGRRSTPEFIEPISDSSEVRTTNPEEQEDLEDNYDSAVPRKREVKRLRASVVLKPPDTRMPSLSPPVLACTEFPSSSH